MRTFGIVLVSYLIGLVSAVTKTELFPFGTEQNDRRLPIGDDISSSEVALTVPVAFFNNYYRSIFVNVNGHLSFETELPSFKSDLILPIGFKVIVPFLADVDTRLSGNVYYRETEDPSLLRLFSTRVQKNFPGRSFNARSLFIVTWDDVGHYQEKYEKTNSFQVVVGSDGSDSYTAFHYVDGGINWLRGDGKSSSVLDDVPAQAGFDAGDNRRSYTLPGSGNLEVKNLAVWSNINTPGAWLFRIGNLGDGNIESADRPTGGSTRPDAQARTCAAGGVSTCSTNAKCVDNPSGFCCVCQKPYFGNGRNCLEPNSAQRVNGKVSGTVNDVVINNVDLHAYVVTSDGRAYTAISRMELGLGYAMQSLYPIGGVMGWLFAVPSSPSSRNGYMITGGDFNRTATMRFVATGESLTINQQFVGQDVLGYMRVTTQINGKIPNIDSGARFTVDDYTEEYRRTGPGVITSFATHTYRVDGIPQRFTLDQTLTYRECSGRPADEPDVLKLAISRSFLVFGEREQIVRYAMTNKISVAGSDPCQSAGCTTNARCRVERGNAVCECSDGYYGDGKSYCQDVDECFQGNHDCAANAECQNTEGSYQCRCLPGYRGDGRTCTRDLTCADILCDANAQCVFDSDAGRPRCECNAGFAGDGLTCRTVEFGCNEVNNCDVNAECLYDPEVGRYRCECLDGFSGDGYSCSGAELEMNCRQCDRRARCVYDVHRLIFRCQCMEGFTGDGNTCFPLEEPCNVINNCDRNAQCLYDSGTRGYTCRCNEGYSGDGYVCSLETCNVVNNCDPNARCLYDESAVTYRCVCNPGYNGDGVRCEEEGCNVRNICDANAQCVYDQYSGRYTCVCNEGYQGDGRQCRTETTDCRRNPASCDANARCTRRGSEYICVCNQGYRGDGTRCAPSSGAADSYLMFAQGVSIMQTPFKDGNGKQTLMIPGQTAIGIDVDCYSRYFYWTDVSGKTISRARLDGTDSEVLVRGLGSPEGVSVDWVARNMYWTDSILDRIEVSKIDGTNRKTIFNTDLVNPRAISVDPARGVMFWTDWNRAAPKIEKSNMDGSGRQVLVSENLGLPNGLAIDFESQKVCWADAGTMHIECVDYSGRSRQVVYSLASYPFDLTYSGGIFYWTDWDMKSLPNIDRYGGEPNEPVDFPVGGNGRVYGIATVRAQCPSGSNACVLNNGGCRFLCLPTPNGGRTCACPDDVEEEECNRAIQLGSP